MSVTDQGSSSLKAKDMQLKYKENQNFGLKSHCFYPVMSAEIQADTILDFGTLLD